MHLGGCSSAGILLPLTRSVSQPSAGVYERYLHVVGSTACLPSNRLLPLPGEIGWERGAVG